MRRALVRVTIAFAGLMTFTGLAVFPSAPAEAGLRFGPGAVLGLVGMPLRMLAHGVGGVPGRHAHVAGARSASARPASFRSADDPSQAPAARAASSPPVEPPAIPAPRTAPNLRTEPPAKVARAEPAQAVETPRPAPPLPAWPTASSSVYEDLLGYVLWPGDYADRLWSHGYGDVVNTLLVPMTANTEQAASLIADGMCSTKASELADRLVTRTREIIEPTPAQQAALDELASALGEAIDRGRTAVCTGTGDALERMVAGLWTMWDATLLMRPPLQRFYDSLTPEQKARLAGSDAASQALARVCADPQAADGAGNRLARVLGADPSKRLTLETLRERSAELIKFLALSCPRETEPTPMDRLAAAGDRMNALLYVVMSMSPAVTELQGARRQDTKPSASDH
jgi:hypothetical protein